MLFPNHSKQAPYKEIVAIRDQCSGFLSTFPMSSWGYICVCVCVYFSHIYTRRKLHMQRELFHPFMAKILLSSHLCKKVVCM